MISKLDKLLAKSFSGPFVVTFAISIFALMMQVLWLYIDDIAGKGLGFFNVVELMAYKCVGLVPLAMPLALLISAVMVLGGMAEHYELSSFKSAGVSLLRVMRPLILFGVLGAIVSFACADYVIPAANLKFGSRMYDIQQKKPTLNMEAGVFNEDFNQFAIRLGEVDNNGRDIRDILIYDHRRASTGDLGQIIAREGEMYTADGGRAFVMKLYDGVQYSEKRQGSTNNNGQPFVRTSFKTYTKVWDLSEFLLGSTAEDLFRTNRSMLATWQLDQAIDSIDIDLLTRKQTVSNQISSYLQLLPRDTIQYKKKRPLSEEEEEEELFADEVSEEDPIPEEEAALAEALRANREQEENQKDGLVVPDRAEQAAREQARVHPLVRGTSNWSGIGALLDSLDRIALNRVINRARSAARSIESQASATQRILPGIRESRVKHIYDLHMKYSMALVCIIFIFIGAPMGAIVRKGGFGYPILVSIIFFVLFIILTIFCRKLAESFVVNGTMAGWLPVIILFPVSLRITRTAMNDGKLINLEGFSAAFEKLKKRLGKDGDQP